MNLDFLRLNLKVRFLFLVVFVAITLLGISDYWLIETLVRYICSSCIGLG